jgi:hypothetical protein
MKKAKREKVIEYKLNKLSHIKRLTYPYTAVWLDEPCISQLSTRPQ